MKDKLATDCPDFKKCKNALFIYCEIRAMQLHLDHSFFNPQSAIRNHSSAKLGRMLLVAPDA